MKAVIYTKPNCGFCIRAKYLLDTHKIQYEELVLDVDFNREELLEKFPDAKTFPQIILDDEYVGGYTELAKKLSD